MVGVSVEAQRGWEMLSETTDSLLLMHLLALNEKYRQQDISSPDMNNQVESQYLPVH